MLEELSPWFFPLPSEFGSILPGSNHDFMNPVYRAVVSSPLVGLLVELDNRNVCFTYSIVFWGAFYLLLPMLLFLSSWSVVCNFM